MGASQSRNNSQADDPSEAQDDGIDVTLIRWVLSMSVTERLELLQTQSDALTELRDGLEER